MREKDEDRVYVSAKNWMCYHFSLNFVHMNFIFEFQSNKKMSTFDVAQQFKSRKIEVNQ